MGGRECNIKKQQQRNKLWTSFLGENLKLKTPEATVVL